MHTELTIPHSGCYGIDPSVIRHFSEKCFWLKDFFLYIYQPNSQNPKV